MTQPTGIRHLPALTGRRWDRRGDDARQRQPCETTYTHAHAGRCTHVSSDAHSSRHPQQRLPHALRRLRRDPLRTRRRTHTDTRTQRGGGNTSATCAEANTSTSNSTRLVMHSSHLPLDGSRRAQPPRDARVKNGGGSGGEERGGERWRGLGHVWCAWCVGECVSCEWSGAVCVRVWTWRGAQGCCGCAIDGTHGCNAHSTTPLSQ